MPSAKKVYSEQTGLQKKYCTHQCWFVKCNVCVGNVMISRFSGIEDDNTCTCLWVF